MARLYEIAPLVSTTRYADGSVEHDDTVMYLISENAKTALNVILEPYDRSAGWYLDGMRVRSPGPWAYVALRQEYDIANYVIGQREKLDRSSSFKFTYYDGRSDTGEPGFIPKVGCFLFFSKGSLEAAAQWMRFLEPAWTLLRGMPIEQHWLVLLDEQPALVVAEARQH